MKGKKYCWKALNRAACVQNLSNVLNVRRCPDWMKLRSILIKSFNMHKTRNNLLNAVEWISSWVSIENEFSKIDCNCSEVSHQILLFLLSLCNFWPEWMQIQWCVKPKNKLNAIDTKIRGGTWAIVKLYVLFIKETGFNWWKQQN